MAPFIIETPAEYEANRDRVNALLENFKEGTPEQVELDALTAACAAWEAKVDLGSDADGRGNVPGNDIQTPPKRA